MSVTTPTKPTFALEKHTSPKHGAAHNHHTPHLTPDTLAERSSNTRAVAQSDDSYADVGADAG